VQEEPHVKGWEDAYLGIQNMSIEETYGFGILNEGQAIAVCKNVKIRPNEFVLPARSVFNINEAGSTFEDLSTRSLSRHEPKTSRARTRKPPLSGHFRQG
jgi:hypothetical protein